MRIKLLFFATLRERAGLKSMELDIPEGTTVQQLKHRLSVDYPALQASLPTVLISVNKEFAFPEAILPPEAEVALFPPVSGG